MHVISGLTKRAEVVVVTIVGVTGEADRAKKPTVKEIIEEELRSRLEQTIRNLVEAPSVSGGGTDSDNHGSELGVPPEVAEEKERHAFRERDWEVAHQRANEEAEDTNALEI